MLNFMKGSLFSRGQKEIIPEKSEQDVQVLAAGRPLSACGWQNIWLTTKRTWSCCFVT